MNVKIWDVKKKTWINKQNIQHIYLSVLGAYFKLDTQIYRTDQYELNFVNQ